MSNAKEPIVDNPKKSLRGGVKVAYQSTPPPLSASLAWVESQFKGLEERIKKLEDTLESHGIYL